MSILILRMKIRLQTLIPRNGKRKARSMHNAGASCPMPFRLLFYRCRALVQRCKCSIYNRLMPKWHMHQEFKERNVLDAPNPPKKVLREKRPIHLSFGKVLCLGSDEQTRRG